MNPAALSAYIETHSGPVRRFLLYAALAVFAGGVLAYVLQSLAPELSLPDRIVPQTLLGALVPAFSIILVYELFLLTLGATGSIVTLVVRLFEVVSLILLRDLFKQLDKLSGSFSASLLAEIAIVAVGAVALYVLIEVLQRLERHFVHGELKEELPGHEGRRQQLVKDSLELLLLAFFTVVALAEAVSWILGYPGAGFNAAFVHLVFSGLIVYAVFLLLLVLTTTDSYETLFEHSALVLTAVLALVAFDAPVFVRVPMLVASLLFVIVVLMLHGFARGKSFRFLVQPRGR